MAQFLNQTKSSEFVEENMENLVKGLNVKFQEKGLDTRLNKKELIQKLSEDIQKLKTKIHRKNKRYEASLTNPIAISSDPKPQQN